jgi:hypothetical protein
LNKAKTLKKGASRASPGHSSRSAATAPRVDLGGRIEALAFIGSLRFVFLAAFKTPI